MVPILRFVLLVGAVIAFLLRAPGVVAQPAEQVPKQPPASEADPHGTGIPFDGLAKAPDFPIDIEWLNTNRRFSWDDLEGKVVLLDFWTYCCINCIHVLPDLKKLEKKYADELVVIGVHSAKFENEKDTNRIRDAIRRYEIEHPVVNDKDFEVWRAFGARAWPTLMLVNPRGRIIGGHSGEGIYELFDLVIGKTIEHFDRKNLIRREPVRLDLEIDTLPPTLLAFPGKLCANPAGDRLVVSDSNHNRILIASVDGEIQDVIGDGRIGLRDGGFADARFFRPQGVWLDADAGVIYVADTENHAIREIDLESRTVKTIAGNGEQARQRHVDGKGVPLNSPWDLIKIDGTLYIAMAGPHQLWKLNLATGEAGVFAGTGAENIDDGTLSTATLAQPSGITVNDNDGTLFFADSETSSIRSASGVGVGDGDDGQVKTLIGTGLFDFGDVDGTYPEARLQHPLGVYYYKQTLYIADTYNHKIKTFDLESKTLKTLAGTGIAGFKDGAFADAAFNEPSDVWRLGDRLFVTDTNNHLVRVLDLRSRTVSTIQWTGLAAIASASRASEEDQDQTAPLVLDTVTLRPDSGTFDLRLRLPDGTKLIPNGPSTLRLRTGPESSISVATTEFLFADSARVTIPVVVTGDPVSGAETALDGELTVFYCESDNAGLCYFRDLKIRIPIRVVDEEGTDVAAPVDAVVVTIQSTAGNGF